MKAAGKKYDPVTYDGAGHGFMRAGQAPDATEANKKAYEEGLKRMLSIISGNGSAAAPALERPARAGMGSGAIAMAGTPTAAMDCHDDAHSTNGEMAALMKK